MKKEVTVKIRDFFNFIEETYNQKIDYEKFYSIPFECFIQDKDGNWKKIKNCVKKRDTIIELIYKKFIMKVGSLHKICVDLLSNKCLFAKDLKKGSVLPYLGEKLQEKNVKQEDDVFDIEIDSEDHLYRTTNGVVNHNTEASKQLARITGRDIVKVEMSGLRSKWWGEDEKNVKSIFTHYKDVLQESKIQPILLLNEADAILGKRLDVTGNNGAIISSINAVQNIILEEMENFEGILIATTNLTQNFDDAFERRFLYKIVFDKPNKEQKKNIWQSLAHISDEWAEELADQFDFTGGNIENVYRKLITKKVLYGKEVQLDDIIQLCKEEKKEEKSIGFRN